jgi:hypothetical protein
MSFDSLTIEIMKTLYTEDMIINIFWKNFLGKVYRVDFESIVDYETGLINKEYQTAIIYRDEKYDWNNEVIKSINKTGSFILYHTNFNGSNDCWTMKKNNNPIPRATTKRNIHQLQHENEALKARIAELEKIINI